MSTDNLLGQQIDEYRIETALGAGGMARVYRAMDVKLRRYVALKVIAPDFRADPDYAARFEREAQSLARLEHPNVVRIHRFGEVDGLYYMAMQYIEGSDLAWIIRDYHASGEVMPIADTVRVLQNVAAALDYIHSKGVIHRDVKPHNIIVNGQGKAVLTDFGLALLGDLGIQAEAFGSPLYLAPEQVEPSGQVVPQSDLYSLGVTLYQMLTGQVPFIADNPDDLAQKHQSQMPPPPSTINPAIPHSLDEIILHSLAKKTADRYQSGAELLAAFQRALGEWQPVGISESAGVWTPVTALQSVDGGERDPKRTVSLEALAALPLQIAAEIPQEFVTIPISVKGQNVDPVENPSTDEAIPPVAAGQSTVHSDPPTHLPTSKFRLRSPMLVAAGFYTVGLISMILFFAATRRPGPLSDVILPTTITRSPTAIAPSPTSTTTATPVPTSTPAPTQVRLPPTDRSAVPANSQRLGEFAVESYCNSRGYGVVIVNHRADWACTNRSNGKPVLTLGPKDFDSICQARYNALTAFAIRDQQKPVQAYNWSCYAYTEPTPTPIATPSIVSLLPQFNSDWVALVNVSSYPLALNGIQFKRDDGSTLKGTDWGQTILLAGACLRLFAGQNAPTTPPSGCSTVIDYPGAKDDRWVTAQVMITVNPSTAYCYPSDKCAK